MVSIIESKVWQYHFSNVTVTLFDRRRDCRVPPFPVVLGGDGGAVDAGEVALPEVRVGEDQAAEVDSGLQGQGLCAAGTER